jgi:hypothetical protein
LIRARPDTRQKKFSSVRGRRWRQLDDTPGSGLVWRVDRWSGNPASVLKAGDIGSRNLFTRTSGLCLHGRNIRRFIRESIKKFPQPSLRPAGGVREGSAKMPFDPQVLQRDEHTNRSKIQTSDGPSYLSKPDKP